MILEGDAMRIINYIYWLPENDTTYRYGSKIDVYDNQVIHFENEWMAPGKAMISWLSAVNYQASRFVPQLPLLRGGVEYRIRAKYIAKPADSVMLRVIFYDIQGKIVDQKISHDSNIIFTYPYAATRYEVQLINGGCRSITFWRLELTRAFTEQTGNWMYYAPKKFDDDQPINIMLLRSLRTAMIPSEEMDKNQEVPNLSLAEVAWQEIDQTDEELLTYFENLKNRRINFISTAHRLNPIVRKLIKKSPYWRGWLIDADILLTDYRLSNYEMTSSEGHFFKHLELVPIKQTLDQIKDELKR